MEEFGQDSNYFGMFILNVGVNVQQCPENCSLCRRTLHTFEQNVI